MFSGIDKKVLIILVLAIVVAVLFGIVVYRYIIQNAAEIQNFAGGVSTENVSEHTNDQDIPDVQAEIGGVEVEGNGKKGGLIICFDACGDGVCQQSDLDCPGGSMNCTCLETPEECPQDCH